MRGSSTRRWLISFGSFALAIGSFTAGAPAQKKKKKANMPRNWVWPPDAPMKAAGARCLEDLTTLGVEWKPAVASRAVAQPVLIPKMEIRGVKVTPIFRKPPFVMDCHLARSVARAAPSILASGITELRFSTIHEYRRVRLRGRTLRALSRHSLGLAMDVYEFVHSDGVKVVIEKEYPGSAHAHALEAALSESGEFRALLTPGNDPRSHSDHFHLEARMVIPNAPRPRRKAKTAKTKKKKKSKKRRRRQSR